MVRPFFCYDPDSTDADLRGECAIVDRYFMHLTRRKMLQLSAFAAAAPRVTFAETAPIATTNSGKVRGFVDNGVLVFKGIPYGDDTSKTRFQPPAKPAPY